MKKTQTILAYYCFFLGTGAFFWSLFVSHSAMGFMIALLILPVSIYFWVLVSGKMPRDEHDAQHEHHESQPALGLLISIVLTIAAASILTYISTAKPDSDTKLDKRLSKISTSLSDIQTDVSVLKKNARSVEKLDTKLTLIQSSLLTIDNKSDSKLLDDALQGVLGSIGSSPTATPTPVISTKP